MVRGDRVRTEAAWRLDGHEHVAQVEAGEVQPVADHVDLSWGRTPDLLQIEPGPLGQRGEPCPVGVDGERAGSLSHLGVIERRVVVGETVGQHSHEVDAVIRDPGHAIAGIGQRAEQPHRRRGRVEADGIAQPGPAGRIGGEDDGHAPFRCRDAPEPARAHRQIGQALGPLGVSPGGHDLTSGEVAVVDDLLERIGRPDDATIELGDGHATGYVEGREAHPVGRPLRPRTTGCRSLDHRDGHLVETWHHPPLAIGLAGPGSQRRGGDDIGSELAAQSQCRNRPRGVAAQGVRPDGHGVSPGRGDGIAQVGHIAGVARHQVCPVEDDGHQRPTRVPPGPGGGDPRPVPHADVGHGHGRLEPEPGHPDGVGQEADQVLHIGGAACAEVAVGLAGYAGGNGRRGDHGGVGADLPPDGDQCDTLVDARCPQPG